MKTVLIICYDYVPYFPSLGGVLRVLTLSRYLSKNGWKVFVLTSRGQDFGFHGYEDILKDVEIVYIDDPIKVNIQKVLNKQLENTANKKGNLPLSSLKGFIKSFVSYVVVPDLGVFMVRKYLKSAERIIIKNSVKNVIVSSPPHSMQIVGALLKNKFKSNVNLIVDYRDSWNMTAIFRKKNVIANYFSCLLEKYTLNKCDHFSYVSKPILDKLINFYGIDLECKSTIVMNGFDEKTIFPSVDSNHDSGVVKIGYFGAISDDKTSFRSISNVLDVLIDLASKNSLPRLEFNFYGATNFERYDLQKLPMVKVRGNVPHDEALRCMADMDFLMLLHSDPLSADEVITGKFFDYISMKKPILCFAPQNMEARRLIEKNRLGVNVDIESTIDIAEKLIALPLFLNSPFYEGFNIDQYQRVNQYNKMIELLR
ncbi:hypothetical protein A7E78_01575 [Syntrophotalea acetylenivorans]|uniref:Glycosyltransferase subfamily 4-like N-terminal domain-containing protein n=1 Tax=Syntrophotalea acetylenivorans TaxID=1842532 RepID=A0A1L3GL82_9BACT|nr:hypothetical protein [Syntrophotalea acetylenivorans]APG26665.1 hypothetical protein A7E78_01575 [Syntrophotalea acetylenivorans]